MSEFICSDKTLLPVKVRLSARAKHPRLSLSYTGELEVVIPKAAARKMGLLDYRPYPHAVLPPPVTDFLEQHRPWIDRATKRSKSQRENYLESMASGLPTHLDFPLCNEIWQIEYKQTQAKGITVKPDGLRRLQGTRHVFSLKLSGAVIDEELCFRALIRFVSLYAKEVIPRFAWEVCREISATPNSITVNKRKSAWGVCTRNGDIRIDRRVMFLPRDLARQVVLHEIAHLKHLNHSQCFYDELFSYGGSTREAEKAVKSAIQFVPAWFISSYNRD